MVVVGAGSQHLGPQEEQQVLLDDRPSLQLHAQILILAPRSVNTFSAVTPRELMEPGSRAPSARLGPLLVSPWPTLRFRAREQLKLPGWSPVGFQAQSSGKSVPLREGGAEIRALTVSREDPAFGTAAAQSGSKQLLPGRQARVRQGGHSPRKP